jgi:hypothetical protein
MLDAKAVANLQRGTVKKVFVTTFNIMGVTMLAFGFKIRTSY